MPFICISVAVHLSTHPKQNNKMFDMFWFWILLFFGFASWCYFFLKEKFSYWSSRGINGPKPYWPIGNLFHRTNAVFFHYDNEMVRRYGKVYGTYMGWMPVVSIAEPQLVKQLLIKDFHHFIDRINPKAYHELWNQNLFNATGDNWKRIRTITSPTFSSGKLRGMNSIMQKCIGNLDDYLKRITASTGYGIINTKEVIAGFTIDVIASTAFATDTNANREPNSPFVKHGRKLFEINPFRALAGFMLPTSFLKVLGIETIFDKEAFDFFVDLSKQMVEMRLSGKSGRRNDLLQMLIDASVDEKELDNVDYAKMTATEDETKTVTQTQSSAKKTLTKSEIIANCIIFFVAGFETTASTLSHCIFELAKNPEIQENLNSELHKALDKFSDDQVHSEEYFNAVINDIPYLEALMKETMRRYTPLALLNRVCNTDNYKLGPIVLSKGAAITIPIVAIHMDPENYPEPWKFDPERFMPENKHCLVPYTYMPFSDGPRNCIAMRFAYQEIKLCLAQIVLKYKFSTTPETPRELSFKPNSALLIANEFQIKVEKR